MRRRVVRRRRRDRSRSDLPADVVYARLLLGHLPDPGAALAHWSAPCGRPGSLVCEEPVRYRSDDPLFVAYEAVVTAVVAERGATLWAGPVLDADPPGVHRLLDRIVEHPVRVGARPRRCSGGTRRHGDRRWPMRRI